ncbi:MAG TPA: hypothetical protein VNC78_09170 [Actinomycetota bacterium]|nr:hypothetical protein [Actinomycetota bacterium]
MYLLRLSGAVVPHAVVLIPEIAGRWADATGAIRLELAALGDKAGSSDAIVVISPHSARDCVYGSAEGTLEQIGPRFAMGAPETDGSLRDELAELWGRPVEREPADHGVTVPLHLMGRVARPVIAVGLANGGDEAAVRDLASAIEKVAVAHDIFVMASGHTSAALSPAAPLTLDTDAVSFERTLTRDLISDAGVLSERAEAIVAAGGCGARAFDTFGRLFRGRRARLSAYGSPFGVGYMVAVVS